MAIGLLLLFIILNRYFLFADDIKTFLHSKLATDGTLAQSDIDSIHGWCAANFILTKLNSLPLHGKLIQLIIFTNCVINA
jgi:hypothetical protein